MEKQTLNALKVVYKFNDLGGLLESGYSDERECAYPIEEMLEGFSSLYLLDPEVHPEECSPKGWSRELISRAGSFTGKDVDRLDKHIDAIIFCLGSIYKLGLTPQQTLKAIGIVADANLAKLTVGKDAEGKQLKPDNFVGPEERLQKILDERV